MKVKKKKSQSLKSKLKTVENEQRKGKAVRKENERVERNVITQTCSLG